MAAAVAIISRHGLRNEAHCNNTELALYKPLSCLKQLYMCCNKTECLGYEGGSRICVSRSSAWLNVCIYKLFQFINNSKS